MKPVYALASSFNGHKLVTLGTALLIYVVSRATSEFPPGVLQGIVLLLMADWFMGTARAWIAKKLSAGTAWGGVVKFVVYLVMVAVVNHLARIQLGAFWTTLTDGLLAMVSAAMLITESISVLKHLDFFSKRYDVSLPLLAWLIARLETEEKKMEATP